MHGGGLMNVTRGGVGYLRSICQLSNISRVVTEITDNRFSIEVHVSVPYAALPDYDGGVNLILESGTLDLWHTVDINGDGQWDSSQTHSWVAL